MAGIEVPPGFGWHYQGVAGILIPLSLRNALEAEKLAQQEDSAPDSRPGDDVEVGLEETDSQPHDVSRCDHLATTETAPCLQYPVFQEREITELETRMYQARDADENVRIEKIVKQLRARTPLRKLAPLARAEALARLSEGQPHFSEVVDFVAQQVVLAKRVGGAARIPPILLASEPGLGKTHFARCMAQALGTTYRTLAYDTGVSSASLLGLDRMWSTSAHGILFDLICLGEEANPMIVLEEIDKVADRHNDDPLSPLHTLLEPSTACVATDLSLSFTFDASLVTWVATANDLRCIPAPIRSRFQEFVIEFPTARQAVQLASTLIAVTLVERAPQGFEPAPRHFAADLAHCTAREIRQAVTAAIACAVNNGRNHLVRSDLPARVLCDSEDAGVAWLH